VARQVLEITVSGEMNDRLREEFEDIEITIEHGVTRLRVVSVDASVVHGVLHRIEALGLELLDVHQVDEGSPDGR
jgi:hypothetical protein